ncbi:MAG: hypothetical protein L0154_00950 [Chloroflexi bacterium]|nr:hypothetical protein [Chloroflexota bacterium]
MNFNFRRQQLSHFLFDDLDASQRTIDIRQNSGGPTQHPVASLALVLARKWSPVAVPSLMR